MLVNIQDRLKNSKPYSDKPNSISGNIGETLGIVVLIVFVGGFLYLLFNGMPTIGIVFSLFTQTLSKLFNIRC